MHDGMQYDTIQGQGHEPLKVENFTIFKGYLAHLLWGWQMTTDSWIRAQYVKLIGPDFWLLS